MLGSARPVDGRMPLTREYLTWVRGEAAVAPITYLPHRREPGVAPRRRRLDPRSRRLAASPLPAELLLAGTTEPLEILTLPSSTTTTIPLVLDGTGSVIRQASLRCGRPRTAGSPRDRDRRRHPRAWRIEGRAPKERATRRRPAARRARDRRGTGVGIRRPRRRLHRRRGDRGDREGVGRRGRHTDPRRCAGDEASSESALLHALDAAGRRRACETSILVFLQPTSPFIDGARPGRGDRPRRGAMRTTASSRRSRRTASSGRSTPLASARGVNHDSSVRPRRQDREPHYLETGAFYVMDAAGFRAARHRFFGRVGLVEVAERTAIEIDSEEQLALAQAIAVQFDQRRRIDRRRRRGHRLRRRPHRRHRPVGCRRARARPGEPIRRDGHRPAARRRHPRPHPLHRDQPGRRRREPGSSGSTCGKASTTRPPPSASGPPSTASRSPASPTSATTSTTSRCLELVGWPVAVPDCAPARPRRRARDPEPARRPRRGQGPRRPGAPRLARLRDRATRATTSPRRTERHSS